MVYERGYPGGIRQSGRIDHRTRRPLEQCQSGGLQTPSWSSEEINTITKQWEYNKEIPIVPGSYATTRYLNFAWTDIVISGKEVRSTLEEAAEEVNREIDKKYKEFAKREASK